MTGVKNVVYLKVVKRLNVQSSCHKKKKLF